jgi:acetolactate synthase small subunit
MHVFHIRYRNTQGTLMRILNAASRRGIDMPYVQAEPVEHTHRVTLLLEVAPKQVGQLCRDWNAIVDVIQVRAGIPLHGMEQTGPWTALPHPPAAVTAEAARSATA